MVLSPDFFEAYDQLEAYIESGETLYIRLPQKPDAVYRSIVRLNCCTADYLSAFIVAESGEPSNFLVTIGDGDADHHLVFVKRGGEMTPAFMTPLARLLMDSDLPASITDSVDSFPDIRALDHHDVKWVWGLFKRTSSGTVCHGLFDHPGVPTRYAKALMAASSDDSLSVWCQPILLDRFFAEPFDLDPLRDESVESLSALF